MARRAEPLGPPPAPVEVSAADADALLRQALLRVSLKDAVGEVAEATGLPRRELYQRALALAKDTGKDTGDGAPR
jgi:16S rRNA (cytidine1402-2'-O)-methyltransferase